MFKFIHAADVHLDSPLRGLSTHSDAPANIIRDASRRAFANLVEAAIDQRVSFVVLAGDVFDGGWRDIQTGLYFNRQVSRLSKAGIRVLMVLGNHDAANRMTSTLTLPDALHLFPHHRASTVVFDDLGVAVHGRSFGTGKVADNFARTYPEPLPGMFNIGLLHTSLDGREGHDTYAPCNVQDLTAKGYDYWALGHVHTHEIVSESPWIVFSGCLQGRHARETGPKGFNLVTVTDGSVESVQFLQADVLRWIQLQVSVNGLETRDELLDQVRAKLVHEVQLANQRPLAVRFQIAGSCSFVGDLLDPRNHLDAEIQRVAEEVEPDGLWVEKVMTNVTPVRSLDELFEGDDADLLRTILTTEPRDSDVRAARDLIDALLTKFPDTEPAILQDNDRDRFARSLVDDAKQIIIERLSKSGGKP